jgi:methanogenic corrinoid protein MtbC1
MSVETLEQLKAKLLDLDMDGAVELAELIAGGDVRIADAVNAISEGLEVVGQRFQQGEWFLTELVYAGEIARETMDLLLPLMETASSGPLGTVVVGTVAGDLHDLGKSIFMNYARSAGFKLIDLGVDVPAEGFVSAVKEHHPLALGMSCLLTTTDSEIGKVIEGLKRQNVRDKVKVIIGGAALTEQFAENAGADAFAPDAVTGTDIIRKWGAS